MSEQSTAAAPVFAEYKDVGKERKFQRICVRIGDAVEEVPIKFIRVSEMAKLSDLLERYAASRQSGAAPSTAPTESEIIKAAEAVLDLCHLTRGITDGPVPLFRDIREAIESGFAVRATPAPPVAPTEEEAREWLSYGSDVAERIWSMVKHISEATPETPDGEWFNDLAWIVTAFGRHATETEEKRGRSQA